MSRAFTVNIVIYRDKRKIYVYEGVKEQAITDKGERRKKKQTF